MVRYRPHKTGQSLRKTRSTCNRRRIDPQSALRFRSGETLHARVLTIAAIRCPRRPAPVGIYPTAIASQGKIVDDWVFMVGVTIPLASVLPNPRRLRSPRPPAAVALASVERTVMLNCMDRGTLSDEAKSILDGDAIAVSRHRTGAWSCASPSSGGFCRRSTPAYGHAICVFVVVPYGGLADVCTNSLRQSQRARHKFNM